MKEDMDIEQIISKESIDIYFQPIVSTYQGRVAGVEALVRGINPEDGSIISPMRLFGAAKESGKVIALDRLCQRIAIKKFGQMFKASDGMILFLNVDNSVIHLDNNTGAIYDYSQRYNVAAHNIVLEINELHSADIEAVVRFTTMYREKGFMISIDDIGSGYSNMDRVVLLQPDIIKIDRELIRDIHKHYYKQQVVEMMIRLGERTGALVVAEGVEKLEEILIVLQFGAHLLQGFYIARPELISHERIEEVNRDVQAITVAQKDFLATYMQDKCVVNKDLKTMFESIKLKAEKECVEDEENCLRKMLLHYEEIECAYIIGADGKQRTDTIFNERLGNINKKTLFSPYRRGDDATLKAYYYILETTHQHLYISEEYLSLATGHRCITISGHCKLGGRDVILCLDVLKERNLINQTIEKCRELTK